MKLGKLPPRHDDRTLRLARFAAGLPPAPPAANYLAAKHLGMMLNDQIGDCGLVAPGHYEQCVTAANGEEFVPPDSAILKAYQDVGGYVPGDESTDNGVIMLNVMNYWRRTGIAGRKIDGYVAADLKNRELFKLGIFYGGGMVLGFDLPSSAKGGGDCRLRLGGGHGDPSRGSWGGHAVSAHGYRSEELDGSGVWIVTWGEPVLVSWDFVDAYCDEAYVPVSRSWADSDGAPNGFPYEEVSRRIAEVAA